MGGLLEKQSLRMTATYRPLKDIEGTMHRNVEFKKSSQPTKKK